MRRYGVKFTKHRYTKLKSEFGGRTFRIKVTRYVLTMPPGVGDLKSYHYEIEVDESDVLFEASTWDAAVAWLYDLMKMHEAWTKKKPCVKWTRGNAVDAPASI